MQTSMLQGMGAKQAVASNLLEAASHEGFEVAQASSSLKPQLMESNPGKLPLPKTVSLGCQVYVGQLLRALTTLSAYN